MNVGCEGVGLFRRDCGSNLGSKQTECSSLTFRPPWPELELSRTLSLSSHRPKPIWPKPLSPATVHCLNLHSHTSMAPPTATTSHSQMALTLGFLPPKTHSLISRGQPRAEPDEHHHHSRQHSSKAPPQLVAISLSLALSLSISLLFSDLFVSDSMWVWDLDLVWEGFSN